MAQAWPRAAIACRRGRGGPWASPRWRRRGHGGVGVAAASNSIAGGRKCVLFATLPPFAH